MFRCVAAVSEQADRARPCCWWTSPARMVAPLSRRSEMLRTDAAYGLAVLLREICEEVSSLQLLRRAGAHSGAAWVRAARRHRREPAAQWHVPGQGAAVKLREPLRSPDRHHRRAGARLACPRPRAAGYVINVASYKNGVGYGKWTHIDGWSESVIEYIRALESDEGMSIN